MQGFKKITALTLAVVFAAALFSGCGGSPSVTAEGGEAVHTATNPAELYENSSYPGVTFNETTLVFIEDMFDDSLVSVYSNETGETYTIANEANRETFGEQCNYYLCEDVIASIRDDWQTEKWDYLEGASFKSDQPQVIFTDVQTGNFLQFWLQAKFVAVQTSNNYMIFGVTDETVAAVSRQHQELPTATSSRRTAEQTVTEFFDALNAKDAEAYNALMATPVQDPVFDEGVSDTVTATNNLGHIGDFPAEWYENPYANRVVVADFTRTITTKGGLFGGGSKTTQEMRWEFYLVRESADAEWKIAAYGEA